MIGSGKWRRELYGVVSPRNLMVAQSSGVSRDDKMLEQGLQVQATEVHTSFEGIGPNPDLKEQGSDVSEAALDTGDLNSNVTN